jgi:hypothetical protein
MKGIMLIVLTIVSLGNCLLAQVVDSLLDLQKLSDLTVMLYQPTTDTSAETGSGTIINHNGRLYLLTASHVAKEMKNDAKILFRLGGDKPEILDLLRITPKNALEWKHHPTADIALIELIPSNERQRDRLNRNSFPSNSVNWGKNLPQRDADLTFLGYPVIDMDLEHFSPLVFTGYLSSGLITQKRYDTKTKCNFFYLNVPSIQGCSGSGVYYSVKKAGYYFGEKKTWMIGIVHGTQGDNTGGKLAAVTPSYYIFELLEK